MSRIGRKPVAIPPGVEVTIGEKRIAISGPLGRLEEPYPPHVEVRQVDGHLEVHQLEGAPRREGGAMQGLMRALLANMVTGVTKGYTRSLDLIGAG